MGRCDRTFKGEDLWTLLLCSGWFPTCSWWSLVVVIARRVWWVVSAVVRRSWWHWVCGTDFWRLSSDLVVRHLHYSPESTFASAATSIGRRLAAQRLHGIARFSIGHRLLFPRHVHLAWHPSRCIHLSRAPAAHAGTHVPLRRREGQRQLRRTGRQAGRQGASRRSPTD